MDGTKLPPFIVFARPHGRVVREFTLARLGYPQDLVYAVQSKAWVGCQLFLDWIRRVWAPYTTGHDNGTYLLMDEFKVHMMGEVVRGVQNFGTEVDFIPGGYTGRLQVLDLGINKPFKDNISQAALQWQISNPNNAKPLRADVARWIRTAWDRITVENITNTSRSVGLTQYQAD